MFCDWEPAIIHTLFSSCHGCQVCLYNKYSEVLSFIGTVACKRVKVPVEFWNKALQNALPASPHTRIKKSNLRGHSHRVNCSALWVPRPPSLNDNTSSVAVTIALLSESEVADIRELKAVESSGVCTPRKKSCRRALGRKKKTPLLPLGRCCLWGPHCWCCQWEAWRALLACVGLTPRQGPQHHDSQVGKGCVSLSRCVLLRGWELQVL